MEPYTMREPLPDRRRCWTQKVKIEGQSVYLCVGEYADGRPGEIFVDVAKAGTFLSGVMGALAKTISIALQCGADIEMVIASLRETTYPPNGQVIGSSTTTQCTSVTDWIAAELEARYMAVGVAQSQVGEGDPISDKQAGYVPEGWRVGA